MLSYEEMPEDNRELAKIDVSFPRLESDNADSCPVSLDEVIELVNDKPQNVELILTGRYAEPKLVQMADLVTEMLMVKHPYSKGVKAHRGIDY